MFGVACPSRSCSSRTVAPARAARVAPTRNHAAFWRGHRLTLTPAYDLEPVSRRASVASHAITLTRKEWASQLRLFRAAAAEFHITRTDPDAGIDHVVSTIELAWEDVCDQARLTRAEREGLLDGKVLDPSIFQAEAERAHRATWAQAHLC